MRAGPRPAKSRHRRLDQRKRHKSAGSHRRPVDLPIPPRDLENLN